MVGEEAQISSEWTLFEMSCHLIKWSTLGGIKNVSKSRWPFPSVFLHSLLMWHGSKETLLSLSIFGSSDTAAVRPGNLGESGFLLNPVLKSAFFEAWKCSSTWGCCLMFGWWPWPCMCAAYITSLDGMPAARIDAYNIIIISQTDWKCPLSGTFLISAFFFFDLQFHVSVMHNTSILWHIFSPCIHVFTMIERKEWVLPSHYSPKW